MYIHKSFSLHLGFNSLVSGFTIYVFWSWTHSFFPCAAMKPSVSDAVCCLQILQIGDQWCYVLLCFAVACHGPAHIIAWHASSDKHPIHAELFYYAVHKIRQDHIQRTFSPYFNKVFCAISAYFRFSASTLLSSIPSVFSTCSRWSALWWSSLMVGPDSRRTQDNRNHPTKDCISQTPTATGFFPGMVTLVAVPAAET